MNTYAMVQGTTDPLDVQFKNDGVPFNAEGMTVTMTISTADGSPAPSVVGKVNWYKQEISVVRYTPTSTDLKSSASPYSIRFIVTDIDGKTDPYPRFREPDFIEVSQ